MQGVSHFEQISIRQSHIYNEEIVLRVEMNCFYKSFFLYFKNRAFFAI